MQGPTRSRRKICFFTSSLAGGGAERAIVNLSGGFARRGYDVDLVLVKARGPLMNLVSPDVRLVDLGASRIVASLPALARYLRSNEPDAVISFMTPSNCIALLANRFAKGNHLMIMVEQQTLSEAVRSGALRKRLLPHLARICYKWATYVIGVSEGVAADIKRTIRTPDHRIRIIHNPIVSDDLFRSAQGECPHRWMKGNGIPVIVGVGRLTAAKSFGVLLEAFELVRRTRMAKLVILGEGEERFDLERKVRELGIADDVDLVGFVDNPYSFMRAASLFVLSSSWEGLPTVLIEALALGTPVVSTDCKSGPREILDGGRYGKLVPVNDPVALAEAIREALDNPQRPDPDAAKRYTLEESVTRYAELVEAEP